MNAILNKILLSKEIPVNLSYDELNEVILKIDQKLFRIHELQSGEYKFLSNFSLGTAIVKGNPGMIEGIKIFGEIQKKTNSTSILVVTSKLRIELVFICIFWIGMILFQIFGNDKMSLLINMLMFPVILIWFWFVYRIQEKSLLKKVENKIKNALRQGV
ncbi:hypothetical protein [Persicobacter psychrovividus]|uniref:Uncharacterized protein n=1 Tax=Persicobacter psychrovividus TaxID=387638 RepID=A0ABM7VHZ0_9BACT|nr:hypothetical protein PEPS_28710 [Persicobacter psychrovividus]